MKNTKYTKEFLSDLTLRETQKLLKTDEDFKVFFAEYLEKEFPNLEENINNFAKIVKHAVEIVSESIRTFNSKLTELGSELYEAFKPNLEIIDLNKSLYKKGWVLSPYLLNEKNQKYFSIKFLSEIDNTKKLDRHYQDFLTKKSFYHLEKMVISWNSNKFFKRRSKSLIDSVNILRLVISNKQEKINISNFVLPFLIAQIDGIVYDFLEKKGYTFDRTRIHKNNRSVKKFEWIQEEETNLQYYSIVDFIENVLFGVSFPKQNIKNKVFYNRNKIMHGENLKYGTMKNVLRTYLILDYLSKVTDKDNTTK
ncbi:MAG: hypothetical protein JST55_12485 [Bacteroidetes bacterium]|nr:hypothetical protein [Bacteroidota bacterium]